MVFKQFPGSQKSLARFVNREAPEIFNFFIREKNTFGDDNDLFARLAFKVRVIDSIHISIQQPIVHPAILRRFDNLCFAVSPDNASTTTFESE